MIRFGLCCLFKSEPVKFRALRACSISGLPRKDRLARISSICLANSESLMDAVRTVDTLGFGAFRIMSQLFPLYTHPREGYSLEELPDCSGIISKLSAVKEFSSRKNIRLSFHPDQFIVLSSPDERIVENSISELKYHSMLSELIGSSVINIHAGGTYKDKAGTITRFCRNFEKLPQSASSRLTVENDDRSYTPDDIYPICIKLGIPMVYDVHHHRCNPDGQNIEEATRACIATWRKSKRGEPYFHVSSPRNGWEGMHRKHHSDFISPSDFPAFWKKLKNNFTVDVEAKEKELAVLEIMRELMP